MTEIFQSLPSTLIGWFGLLALGVMGVLALYATVDKVRKERRTQYDQQDDRLINLLKTTVDQLEKKVEQQTKDIESLTIKVSNLDKENKLLISILQGRDEKTEAFHKAGLEAFKLVSNIAEHLHVETK